MANNVAITAGSGTNVATDQLADLSHVQLVKLMAGAEDATARLDGDATNGLDVDVTRMISRVSYQAVYRLAARPYAISKLFTAGSRFQFATLHHLVGAVKTVRIARVLVAIESASAAGIVVADLNFVTAAPATGNPAITPTPVNRASAAAEAVALCLPTTAGTEGALLATAEWNLGVTAAGSVVNPPPALQWVTLYEFLQNHEEEPITLRASTLEGIAVTLDVSTAITVKGFVIIEFTEA